jgi:hypothetical protein
MTRRLGAQHGVTARGPRSSSGGLGRRGGGAGGEKGLYFSYPFRFGLNDETPSVLAAGQALYEPSGAKHTGGDSANPQWGARILAIIIAPVGKK